MGAQGCWHFNTSAASINSQTSLTINCVLFTMAFVVAAVFFATLSATGVSAADSACQCEGGDYWCASDGQLRYTYNCSGSVAGKSLWKKITDAGEKPAESDCKALVEVCDGSAGAHGSAIEDSKCEDSCYDFCWKHDVGDCADMDDEQIFCVGECMSYCIGKRCIEPRRQGSSCQTSCAMKHMEVKEINFVDYSLCMAKCTPVPISGQTSVLV